MVKHTFTPRLWPWLLVSLGVHGALTLPWMHGWEEKKPPERRQPLNLDFLGVLAERQAQAQQQGAQETQAPQEAGEPKPAPQPRPKQEARKKQPKRVESDKPLVVAEKPIEEPPAEQTPPPAPPAGDAGARPQDASVEGLAMERQQQHIDAPRTEEEALRRYLTWVHRKVQGQLAYPAEVRRALQKGATKVGFRIGLQGEIVGNRVDVLGSSGHPALDQSAVDAVIKAAPFPPPMRELRVAFNIGFRAELRAHGQTP
ncbi:cell envelope integrity protein TolA [Pseudothauera rhizosphaerae]|uniref:TonB family protein n=1 Tax=Pseudothauera rhizosphaerae TaxID=2565932 RepID=A0A4S4AMN6_9RHOO|nr:TonB family protein [Pseudothauera rhizosphaerae]THF60323.1 TonB family protein [Pseudothauera rhizosphaerae]